jgi:hypothetical protein
VLQTPGSGAPPGGLAGPGTRLFLLLKTFLAIFAKVSFLFAKRCVLITKEDYYDCLVDYDLVEYESGEDVGRMNRFWRGSSLKVIRLLLLTVITVIVLRVEMRCG